MNRLIKRSSNQKGFTLVELLFALVICMLVLTGVIQALLYLTSTSSSNKKRLQVLHDVQMTMERITGTTFVNLTTTFPNNQTLSSAFVTNVLGGYKIPGETITVSYPNGAGSNPVEVLVTGQWPEQTATRNLTLRTFRRG